MRFSRDLDCRTFLKLGAAGTAAAGSQTHRRVDRAFIATGQLKRSRSR
jgi:hypothetical protein